MTQEPARKNRARLALLIEREPGTAELMIRLLADRDVSCMHAATLAEGMRLIRSGKSWDLALVSWILQDGEGSELIRQCSKANPAAPVYALTDPADVIATFQALKTGVRDCIIKYPDPAHFCRQASLALWSHDRSSQPGKRPSTIDLMELGLRAISWKSGAMQRALAASYRAASDRQALVIQGEPSTGRDAFIQLMLREAKADSEPIAIFDASEVTAEEAEIRLFGSPLRKRAKPSTSGFLATGDPGWKILHHAECLPPHAQEALAAKISRTGLTAGLPSHFKFIISMTLNGSRFEDASHPLAGLPCHQILTPPLRDCLADLESIMDRMLERICLIRQIGFFGVTPSAIQVLKTHAWPGNLIEFYSVLEHAATHSQDGIIGTDDLPALEQQLHAFKPRLALGIATVQNVQKAALVSALEACNGNRRLAAKKIGVSLRTIYNMIKRYELAEEHDSARTA